MRVLLAPCLVAATCLVATIGLGGCEPGRYAECPYPYGDYGITTQCNRRMDFVTARPDLDAAARQLVLRGRVRTGMPLDVAEAGLGSPISVIQVGPEERREYGLHYPAINSFVHFPSVYYRNGRVTQWSGIP